MLGLKRLVDIMLRILNTEGSWDELRDNITNVIEPVPLETLVPVVCIDDAECEEVAVQLGSRYRRKKSNEIYGSSI